MRRTDLGLGLQRILLVLVGEGPEYLVLFLADGVREEDADEFGIREHAPDAVGPLVDAGAELSQGRSLGVPEPAAY